MKPTHTLSRNATADTFSLLVVFCIVAASINYPSFSDAGEAWFKLSFRWTLPFFFIVTGYFLAAKNADGGMLDVRAPIERLAWLFLIWNLIYFPVKVIHEGFDGYKVFDDLIAPVLIFTGIQPHLWALSALLFGILFIAIMYRFGMRWLLPVVALLSLAIGLLGGGYNVFKLGFFLGFNVPRFWLSIPFVYLGMLAFHKGRPAWWVALLLAVVGAGLQVFEARLLWKNFNLPLDNRYFLFGTIFLAYGMAMLALSAAKFLQHPLLAQWGRDYALGIYLLHPLLSSMLVWLLLTFMPRLALYKATQVVLPGVVFFLALGILDALKTFTPAAYNLLLGIRPQS